MRTPSVTCSAHNATPAITGLYTANLHTTSADFPTAELPTADLPTAVAVLSTAPVELPTTKPLTAGFLNASTKLPTASANSPTASAELATAKLCTTTGFPTASADPPGASANLPATELCNAEPRRFTLFEKLLTEIQMAVWRLSLLRRNILVSGRKERVLRLQGVLVPPVGFIVCQNSRTEALRHYARLWKYTCSGDEKEGSGYVYISYFHDTVILYYEGRNRDDENSGCTMNPPYHLHRDRYIYDVINGLKPGLDKIQSLAVDIAFLRDHPYNETSIHSNIYTLLRTRFTRLRWLTFITQFQQPYSKKRAVVIEDLHCGTLDSIDALYNEISKNLESPPMVIDERGYLQEIKELKAWHEKKGPICSWKVGKVRTDESLEARQWDVYPKGVEHSDVLLLANGISQWCHDNTDSKEFYKVANHSLWPDNLCKLAKDENFQQFISRNPKDPIEVGIGMSGARG